MGVTPFIYVYGYGCHLPVDLKLLCYWTMKILNSDYIDAREPVLLDFEESENWHNRAQEKEPSITELMSYANQRYLNKDLYQIGQKVIVFHTQQRVFPAELRCQWKGPYTISKVF